MKIFQILLLLISFSSFAREKNQIEITTEEGIEVFQNEKYYLLKKNVIIESDEFKLTADTVKAFFSKDLYDIESLESKGNVKLTSYKGASGSGEKLNFSSKQSKISIEGKKSILTNSNLKMESDEFLEINNLDGLFLLIGEKSKLSTETLIIIGSFIEGKYQKINDKNEIIYLKAESNDLVDITNNDLKMFSSKAIFSKKDNIIELFENVRIIRDKETILGDYAKINTLDDSYKVTSNDTNKVKVLLNSNNE